MSIPNFSKIVNGEVIILFEECWFHMECLTSDKLAHNKYRKWFLASANKVANVCKPAARSHMYFYLYMQNTP